MPCIEKITIIEVYSDEKRGMYFVLPIRSEYFVCVCVCMDV